MGFTLGGGPKVKAQAGPSGPAPSSFKLGGGPGIGKVAPARKKGGGGFLHGLGHVLSQGGADLKNVAVHAPGGVATLGAGIGEDLYSGFRHPLDVTKRSGHTSAALEASGKAVVQDLKHPLRHPGYTALDVLPGFNVAGKVAEAGRLAKTGAKASEVAKAATVGVKPEPRVLQIGDMQVRGHYSRAAGSRVVQRAVDAGLQKGAEKPGRVGLAVENKLHKRAAKWEQRNQRVADAVARAPGTMLHAAGAKLKPEELRAMRLVAEETPVARRLGAQEMRKARATGSEVGRHQERIDLTRKAQSFLDEGPGGKPVFKPGPEAARVRKVYDLMKTAAGDREGMLKQLGLMDEQALQAAKTKTARIAAGAKYVEPTAAKLGQPSEGLLRARTRVTRLETLYEKSRQRALNNPRSATYQPGHENLAMPEQRSPTVARLSSALSVAKDELSAMESATAKRVEPTGVVGAADITASPQAIHIGNPVERARLTGKPRVSSTGTLGHTQKPSSLRVATGGSVEHALERGDVTRIVAERHAETVRLTTLDRLVQKVKPAGELTPRRKDDVFLWTDKLISNKRIPKEVRQYLDNPESLAKLEPDKQKKLTDQIKEAVFQREDWTDPQKKAELEAAAAKGQGVFVPRRLLGDAAKRDYGSGGSAPAKFIDSVNNAQKAGLVYLKLNYPIVQGLSNATMNLIQGAAWPHEITRSVKVDQAIGPEYSAVVGDIMGEGAVMQAGFEGQGAVAHTTQRIAHVMSSRVDRPFRKNAFYYEARKLGYDTPAKTIALLTEDANAGDLAEAAQRAKEHIVDFGEQSPFEKNVVRRLIFVYPWQKGATKYAAHFLRDHPVQAAALGQIAAQDKQRSDQGLGAVPSYLEGVFKAGGGLVNPSGVNQFQTPAQIGQSLGGFLTGNLAQKGALQGFLAPVPGIAVGLATGRDDIGRPLKGNALAQLRDLTVAQTPVAALARVAASHAPASVADLSRKALGSRTESKTFPNPNDAYWRFLLGGLYPRQYNKGALNQNAARQKVGR